MTSLERIWAAVRRGLDRFTRDRASRFVWGALTSALVALLVISLSGTGSARAAAREQAQARVQNWVETVLFSNLSGTLVQQPILNANYNELILPIQSSIMIDPRVIRVRIWQPDGTLLFSTDGRYLGGTKTTADGLAEIQKTQTGNTISFVPNKEPDVYETFVPLHVPDRISIVGAAEIDQSLPQIYAGVKGAWSSLTLWFLLGALIFAGLTVLSVQPEPSSVGEAAVADATTESDPYAEPAATAPARAESNREAKRAARAEDLAKKSQDSLREALERLRAAEEAYRWLDAKLKRTQTALGGDVDSGIWELQDKLRNAEAERALLSTSGPTSDLESRVRQLEEELHNAVARAHDADRRALEAETRVLGAASEVASQQRAAELARSQAEAHRRAAQEARNEVDLANARADDAEKHPGQLAEIDQDLLRSLEARVMAAESRAGVAERRLEDLRLDRETGTEGHQVDPLSEAEQSELRARLARTAARKKRVPKEAPTPGSEEEEAAAKDEPGSSDADQ